MIRARLERETGQAGRPRARGDRAGQQRDRARRGERAGVARNGLRADGRARPRRTPDGRARRRHAPLRVHRRAASRRSRTTTRRSASARTRERSTRPRRCTTRVATRSTATSDPSRTSRATRSSSSSSTSRSSGDSALLLCTDGLSDMVPSARLARILLEHAGDPGRAVGAADRGGEPGGREGQRHRRRRRRTGIRGGGKTPAAHRHSRRWPRWTVPDGRCGAQSARGARLAPGDARLRPARRAVRGGRDRADDRCGTGLAAPSVAPGRLDQDVARRPAARRRVRDDTRSPRAGVAGRHRGGGARRVRLADRRAAGCQRRLPAVAGSRPSLCRRGASRPARACG